MKRPILTLCIILCSLGLKISAQTNTNTENNSDRRIIAVDFPVYINTGNADLDAANYENAKSEWIKNNPEKYKSMHVELTPYTGDNSQVSNTTAMEKHKIDKTEFDNMPIDKQEHILSNPDKYIIENLNITTISKADFDMAPLDRQQYILAHPELYQIKD